jgi:hypothetical protein
MSTVTKRAAVQFGTDHSLRYSYGQAHHKQMHTVALQTVHHASFANSYVFWRRDAILRESQLQRSAGTGSPMWEVLCKALRYLNILKV